MSPKQLTDVAAKQTRERQRPLSAQDDPKKRSAAAAAAAKNAKVVAGG